MAVVCTLFIHELNVGTYLKNNRQFKLDDQIRICYQFSRELEHSDLNLNRFVELMSEKEIFSFENLLKIWNKEKILEKTEKVHLPFHMDNISSETYVEQLVWSELGDYIRSLLRKERS